MNDRRVMMNDVDDVVVDESSISHRHRQMRSSMMNRVVSYEMIMRIINE